MEKMEEPTKEQIIHRAYELWEQAGKPDGRDEEFYHQAEQELRNADKDTENQRRELEAVADRSGWKIVKVYEDAGISGAKGRDQRPGLDAMMKAVNAKEFDMVATWSVDRLGRSLTDLLGILQGLHDKGVGLFLHQQGLDTSTTAGNRQ
jgi:DNA invertase Pin-like site-specific DNA recombinase